MRVQGHGISISQEPVAVQTQAPADPLEGTWGRAAGPAATGPPEARCPLRFERYGVGVNPSLPPSLSLPSFTNAFEELGRRLSSFLAS